MQSGLNEESFYFKIIEGSSLVKGYQLYHFKATFSYGFVQQWANLVLLLLFMRNSIKNIIN